MTKRHRLPLDEFGDPIIIDLQRLIRLDPILLRTRMIPTFNALRNSTTATTDECLMYTTYTRNKRAHLQDWRICSPTSRLQYNALLDDSPDKFRFTPRRYHFDARTSTNLMYRMNWQILAGVRRTHCTRIKLLVFGCSYYVLFTCIKRRKVASKRPWVYDILSPNFSVLLDPLAVKDIPNYGTCRIHLHQGDSVL